MLCFLTRGSLILGRSRGGGEGIDIRHGKGSVVNGRMWPNVLS